MGEVPIDRLGLTTEGVESVMVEIGGGELRVPQWRESPGAIVEALAGDIDVVAVEHAVDEAGGEVGGGQPGGCRCDAIEQPKRILPVVFRRLLGIEVLEA